MTRIQYQWIFPDPVPKSISSRLDSFSMPFRSVLYRRGIKTSQDSVSFLLPQDPSFPQALELGHLEKACNLIKESIEKDQVIAVFGDYDTDGITATALLTLALQKVTPRLIPIIPNRLKDGYGLNMSSVDYLAEQGVDLLVTVDNGISSTAEIGHAKSLGMKVIITDHHQPSQSLPDADAIINPKLPGDPYLNKNLAGVGVAYKLICKLAADFPEIKPKEYLDLVAVGTIADVVPLSGENRYLVKQGLIQINQHRRQSILSILGTAGLLDNKISASDISFQVAPRLNSSGRLSDADHRAPLDLLLSSDPAYCGELAQTIENHNDRRKLISRSMQERIESQFSTKDPLPPILISFDPDHDLGVAGITAGYLTRKFYLPSIVGKIGKVTSTASCRSIPEFDIIAALNVHKEFFTRHGGHKLAAGFTIENKDLSLFRDSMQSFAERKLSDLELCPQLDIDAIVTLSELNPTLYRELIKLEPTGEGNPTPIFVTRQITAKQVSRVGKFGEHLKFVVDDGSDAMPAIAFGLGPVANLLDRKVDLAFHLTENYFRMQKELQLQVVDIMPAD